MLKPKIIKGILRCAAPFNKTGNFIYNLVKRSHEFTNKYFAAAANLVFPVEKAAKLPVFAFNQFI